MVAKRDALTGLNNRAHFMKLAEALLQRSRKEQVPFSLFMIDVNHFKKTTIRGAMGIGYCPRSQRSVHTLSAPQM